MGNKRPTITVLNRQRKLPVKLAALHDFAEGAFQECLKLRSPKPAVLTSLTELSVVLISDRRMAELHRRFLQEPGPTDVITFQHGEIFVSTETARRQARRFGTTPDHEMRLYIAHGLLHLHGFDDKEARSSAKMERVQEKLVAEVDRAFRRSMGHQRGVAAPLSIARRSARSTKAG
jgi:probable rRNA maturation factor